VIRVLLADDEALVRTGFARLLRDAEGMEVVGEAANGPEAVALARSTEPDVILMDIRMPILDGVSATRTIVGERPHVKVLVLTTFDLDEVVYDALEAGASGFLLKDVPYQELLRAIVAVHDGDAVLAPAVTRRLIANSVDRRSSRPAVPALDRLTDREREVLTLLADGLSNAEIGERLFLSEATIKTHVGRVLTKLGCRDRVQAVALAYRSGFVS